MSSSRERMRRRRERQSNGRMVLPGMHCDDVGWAQKLMAMGRLESARRKTIPKRSLRQRCDLWTNCRSTSQSDAVTPSLSEICQASGKSKSEGSNESRNNQHPLECADRCRRHRAAHQGQGTLRVTPTPARPRASPPVSASAGACWARSRPRCLRCRPATRPRSAMRRYSSARIFRPCATRRCSFAASWTASSTACHSTSASSSRPPSRARTWSVKASRPR